LQRLLANQLKGNYSTLMSIIRKVGYWQV